VFSTAANLIPNGGATKTADSRSITNHYICAMTALDTILDTTVTYPSTGISYSYRTLLTDMGFLPGGNLENHFSVKFKGLSRFNIIANLDT